MKITCAVEISNRCYPAVSARNQQKYQVATLALCHKTKTNQAQGHLSDKNVLLILCTHQNPKGTKYKLYNYVDKVFTKFSNDGKARIRFKQPPHDIIISEADPLQLRGFLHSIGLIIFGQGAGKVNFSSPPTEVDRPKEKLSIMKPKDYHRKSRFSKSFSWLQVQTCSLRKIDNEILKLRNLQVLDLAHNCIQELPIALAEIKLKELVLHHNEIVQFPKELSTGALGETLQVLDLSFNKINNLSPFFCLMKKLYVLSLKNNRLTKLPINMHCLESLKIFSASDNGLNILPFGMCKLHLDTLDLIHNPFDRHVLLHPTAQWELPSLQERAASIVVDNQIPYSAKDIPSELIDYLAKHCPCPCGKKVFQLSKKSSFVLVLNLQKLANNVTYINNSSNFKVPHEVYFCSSKCWKKIFSD